jgi:outer membrane lipoprotein-sorting protein
VWWRGAQDWRVDTVQTTGEAGIHHDADGEWSWDFEQNTTIRTTEPTVRLPRVADVEPAALARRLLSEARPADVSRLPARRVAGRDAPGLRLRPSDAGTTIDRVDVWVDAGTGLPLRVEVYGKGTGRPVLETAFLDVTIGTPAAATTRFVPPDPASVRGGTNPDLAASINVFSPVIPPATLAGLPSRTVVDGLGSIGTYGSGLTLLVAVPLPGRISRPLRDQLAKTPGATETATGVRLAVGPLSLLLTQPAGRRSWLVTGTVTADTLDRAAAELAANPPQERQR